jgi:hypothetical protein
MNELRTRQSHSPIAPPKRLTARRGRTPRSTGPATACVLARAAVSVIIRHTGQAARRSGPVTSNVRPRQSCRAMRRSASAMPRRCRARVPMFKLEPSAACRGWRFAPACCAAQSVNGVLCLPPPRATPPSRHASDGCACQSQSAARTAEEEPGAWTTPQENSLPALARAPSQASRRARMNALRSRQSHSPVEPPRRFTARRGRTPRSTGPATACVLARAAVSVIIRRTGQAARRVGPVTSNVRHHRTVLPCA